MKSSKTTKMMLAAALLTAASTVASAQNMRAEIPFEFYAGGNVLPPGTYEIQASVGESRFELLDTRNLSRVMLISQSSQDPQKEWKTSHTGVLQFACGQRGCALAQIWTNGSGAAHRIASSRLGDRIGAGVAFMRVVYSTK